MKKGIYLASHIALHENRNLIYQDINGKRDIAGCMLDVDLTPYDYVIATPPCNYWSIANYRRDVSEYSLKTRHLLPSILKKLISLDKPFIVENVRNAPMFNKAGLFDLGLFVYEVGRHTYFTNIPFNPSNLIFPVENVENKSQKNRQGGLEVKTVIELWVEQL